MSILIKGLSMPKGDEEIRLRIDAKGEVYIYGAYPTQLYEAVELPPHGDLSERDVAYDMIAEVDHGGNYVDMDAVGRGLDDAPTIIEAEGEA